MDWWVVFWAGWDSGLSGRYLMFCAGQYVAESWANSLGGVDMQVRSHFGLWAELKPGCQSSFSRLSGQIRMCASLLSAPVCGIVLGFVIANDFWGLAWDWILFLFFKRKCLRDWTESEQILLRDIQQPRQFRTRIIITKFVSMIWFIPDSVDSYICLCLKFQFF
jgi:hypothetical protein